MRKPMPRHHDIHGNEWGPPRTNNNLENPGTIKWIKNIQISTNEFLHYCRSICNYLSLFYKNNSTVAYHINKYMVNLKFLTFYML